MVPEVWVDRYDARLLLDSFHVNDPKGVDIRSESPAGWSDLPSDSEDTFFFSPEETDDYRREKRRRLMGQAREERLRARIEEDGEGDEDLWGGSDEEPDESVKQVMEKTAKLILLAPNPTQMEMKILVDFGEKQPAFAFLKGRWKRRWRIIRASTSRDLKQAEELQAASKGLGGLAGYGDSDDEGSNEEASNKE
ncbi:hypothetical protein BDZ89DRAFT_1059041 [Hymenopellis radicata]|nr:hypothetical protein BDZ89DRAFT_1059041 [Hymenopellis radicata]